MPASRWNTDYLKLLASLNDTDDSSDFLENPDDFQLISSEEVIETDKQLEAATLPNSQEISILPLRGVIAYPQTVIPLTIGQPRSIRLVDDAVSGERLIGLVAAINPELENPGPEDLYRYGTLASIHRLFRAPDGTIRLLVQGLSRFKLIEFTALEPYLQAKIEPAPELIESGLEIEALARNVRDQFEHIAEMLPSMPRELVASVTAIQDPLQVAYTVANFQRLEIKDAQKLLELDSVTEKLRRLVTILARESEVLELGQKIQNEARTEIEKMQREYFLREQLKAIQHELGEKDEQAADIEEFRTKINESALPEEVNKQALRELDRLSRLPTAAAEYGVIRTYLDWIVSLPWSKFTQDNLDVNQARTILNEDHFGLGDVKERILEFLAVRQLRIERKDERLSELPQDLIRREREGVILCFIGPPGVGKTSLGQSIARALNRKFIRSSLGGVRDEAEIRGHRRTYIGSMPGRILQSLRRAESRNPVFMLDEIDKLSSDFHGDPASALLEVLDPEQNNEFRDNYLEVPFDLSQVMFITTANQLETIPAPLLDRMEIIRIAGYTEHEKTEIASQYLIPRQLRENGLRQNEVRFTKEALLSITRLYTREAGVRSLEREIGSICRKIATRITEGKENESSITPEAVRTILGRPRFIETEEILRRTSVPGVATGLAWTPVGGEVLFIEASKMPGAKNFTITGSIGKVMQESAQAALTYIRAHAADLEIDPEFYNHSDLHIHIPSGAQPKDGPSAGVTITTALVSLLRNQSVHPDVGMTGEISLLGLVMPVGGIKEKVLAAHRAGLKTIILPKQNEPDLEELPDEVLKDIHFKLVETLPEVIQIALGQPIKSSKKQAPKPKKVHIS